MRFRASALAVILAVFAALFSGCAGDPEPRLRVGTFQWPGYEPFFLARSLGYYDKSSIQLVEYPSAAEAILAYKHRAIDAVTVTLDEFVRLVADGHDACLVLIIDYSAGGDVIIARDGIEGLAGLKGRRIGVETQSLGGYVLWRALGIGGLAMSDVEIVTLRQDELEQGIQQGRLDAVVTYEPYGTRIRAAGGRNIFDSTQIPGEVADALITRGSMAERPPRPLTSLVDGWFRALAYLKAHPMDAAARVAPREQLTPEQFLETLKGLKFLERDENRRILSSNDDTLPDHLRSIAGYLVGAGAIDTPPEMESMRSNRVIESLGP
jgi:NitT/TauT family transport system substrate-binding protein